MRIVYVSDAAYEGGAERYLLRLGGGLDRRNWTPLFLLPDRRELDPFAAAAEKESIEVRRYPAGGLKGIGSPAALVALRGLKPDIAHLNLPSTYDLVCGAAAWLARAAGARAVVSTEHIVDVAPSRRRAVLKRLSLSSIDRVIAISSESRRILETRHGVPGARLRVILNGVEDPGQPEPRHNPIPLIVCVGTLEPRKGQDLLIEALAGLIGRGLDARLILVGDGPDRVKLEARVRSGGDVFAARVTFTGRLESAWAELRRADIVAVPSRREGLPFAVMEGMAAGGAVISAALPGIEEVVAAGRTGMIVPIDDLRAWTEGLAALVSDRALRLRLAGAARRDYEDRFTVGRMVSETESLYREVLA